MSTLLQQVTILDTDSPYHLQSLDILIDGGCIKDIQPSINTKIKNTINAKGSYLSSAWIDTFADLAYPGGEERETVDGALSAAAHSGIGHILVAPNNKPPTTNASAVTFLDRYLNHSPVQCHIIGAVSQSIEGQNLAEMIDMHHAGAIAFSDGWKPVQRDLLTQQSLHYTKAFGGIIIQLPINDDLNQDGIMNESISSTQYGINSMPAYAEEVFILRQIEILKYTQGKLHISGISTKRSLDIITRAKRDKIDITCSVTPYHLLYDDSMLSTYDGLYKVNPPLRTIVDRQALIKGVKVGTIDAIASHHRPQNWDGKECELAYAKWGMACMDVLWQMLIKAIPDLPMEQWLEILVDKPSSIFGIEKSPITIGSKGVWTLASNSGTHTITASSKRSSAYNVPLLDEPLIGQASIIY